MCSWKYIQPIYTWIPSVLLFKWLILNCLANCSYVSNTTWPSCSGQSWDRVTVVTCDHVWGHFDHTIVVINWPSTLGQKFGPSDDGQIWPRLVRCIHSKNNLVTNWTKFVGHLRMTKFWSIFAGNWPKFGQMMQFQVGKIWPNLVVIHGQNLIGSIPLCICIIASVVFEVSLLTPNIMGNCLESTLKEWNFDALKEVIVSYFKFSSISYFTP